MKRSLYLICAVFLFNSALAQDLKKSAQDHFTKQEWAEASKAYRKFLKKNEGDSLDWYRLAVSQLQLAEYDKAIEAYREAQKKKFPPAFVYFGMSKSYALKKDKGKLMTTLNEGAANGLGAYALLQSDPAFADYQETTEFKEVLKKVEYNAYSCLRNQNYRHFDFWLGEWEVFVNGNKVGDNSITMAKGGCAIHENYITAGNYAGQSINFYDPIDKKWHQHWVGSGGDVYNYLETKKSDGLLQFESKFMGPGGQISLSRLTFTLNEDGTVRQLFENSTDEGKTWTPSFDGLYKKKQ